MVNLPARGMSLTMHMCISPIEFTIVYITAPHIVPPTPTEVTVQLMDASSIRVEWQWASSGAAPNCFNTTSVTFHPEGGDEFSLQLSNPAATEATLTGLQCNTSYVITVVATAGEHRRESVAFLPLEGIVKTEVLCLLCSHDVCYCRSTEPFSICAISYLNTSDMGGSLPHTAVPHLLQGDMWGLC